MTWNGPTSRNRVVPGGGSQNDLIEEAIETLEKAVKKNAVFLWTGGKEAQVIADLLLYEVGGEQGVSPVPFATIDTGNHFEEMYEFRKKFLEASGDQGAETVGPFLGIGNKYIEKKYEELLENIIENPYDPRSYHGQHSGEWRCPKCGEPAELDRQAYRVECGECGDSTKLKPVQRQNLDPEDWGVPESCGTLKVVPMKRLIEEDGFNVLITGIRGSDPLANTDDYEAGKVEERDEPGAHVRYNPLVNWEEANVWAYLKMESVSYPQLYNQGYRHTDAECCTEDPESQVSEYGEGGRDAEKEAAKDALQDMGYV